jgi:serine/threonine protein kinase
MMRKPKMDKLSRGFQRFHAYLQTLKVDQRVTWKQLLGATGWKESTLQTYLRKNKLAGFLAELPNASFQVLRNGDSITEADIAGALSQVTPEVMSLYRGEKLKGESSLYVLEKKLGEGAVGHVWAARAEKGNGAVAIKIVNPRPDLLERSMVKNIQTRFRREAKHGRNLSSDCIVQMRFAGVVPESY